MEDFLTRTGATAEREPIRYLWTDAFAVCNLLALAQETGQSKYLELAHELVDQVHRILGRHRADDRRKGWISGLPDDEGQRHPTAGGLRIGKPLRERRVGEAMDERLEWDRDGQYFHYLTKWVHALDVCLRRTADAQFGEWSRELLQTACDRFTVSSPGGGWRMVWKMSIDLSRPLVSSMGHHDPLDGYVRCLELRASALATGATGGADAMASRAARLSGLIRRNALATGDPLGIGGLLMDAVALAQLIDGDRYADDGLLDTVLAAAIAGVHHYRAQGDLNRKATQRLAFRELGLSIGLKAVPMIEREIAARRPAFRNTQGLVHSLGALAEFSTTGEAIDAFWLTPEHRASTLWLEHENINAVMLATALVPDGFLSLRLK
jgi:hypothetical protein